MKDFERGPIRTYEVTWASGHIETVQAHQVLWPSTNPMFGEPEKNPKVMFHGEFDGQWRLVLLADQADIRSVRDVTDAETLTEGGDA